MLFNQRFFFWEGKYSYCSTESVKTLVAAKHTVLDIAVGHRPKSELFYTTPASYATERLFSLLVLLNIAIDIDIDHYLCFTFCYIT